MTDTNFAVRLTAQRTAAGITEHVFAFGATIHVTPVRRYEARTSQPKLDVLRAVAALSTSANSLPLDGARGPTALGLRLKLETHDRLDAFEQAQLTALIEGAALRHDARRHLTGQGS